MLKTLPLVSKQIRSTDINNVINKNYASITPAWVSIQMTWLNDLYRTFYDYEKYMIITHLLVKTFDFYSKNFVRLNYEEFFSQNKVEIESLNVSEISKSLNIPKESTRRKINELEELGTIKRLKKKIIIDRNTWPSIKPENTMKRISFFLSSLSKMVLKEGLISERISSDHIARTSKENFSFVWKLYYQMQMPMLLSFKKVYGDLETFHIHGICVSNHASNLKNDNNRETSKENYLRNFSGEVKKDYSGINAMSISDISGIPRATVIRKLNKLIKEKFLTIDSKKLYYVTGVHHKKITEVQKNTYLNLSKFATRIYNLSLIKNN